MSCIFNWTLVKLKRKCLISDWVWSAYSFSWWIWICLWEAVFPVPRCVICGFLHSPCPPFQVVFNCICFGKQPLWPGPFVNCCSSCLCSSSKFSDCFLPSQWLGLKWHRAKNQYLMDLTASSFSLPPIFQELSLNWFLMFCIYLTKSFLAWLRGFFKFFFSDFNQDVPCQPQSLKILYQTCC